MLAKPDHIRRADVDSQPITYEWHDWHCWDYCEPVDKEFVSACSVLEPAAISALTIAEGEWLLFRFDRVSKDPKPYSYLESAWCANVDRYYSWPIELPREDWQGPVRRPLQMGVILVNHPLYELEDGDNAMSQPALMSKLIEHVLPDPSAFLAWRSKCLVRLQQFYRLEVRDPFEDLFDEHTTPILVPREVFDPELEFRPEMARELVERFLRSVDYANNPFLLTPEQMRAEGFEGVAYVAP